jgi:hypothetical protein
MAATGTCEPTGPVLNVPISVEYVRHHDCVKRRATGQKVEGHRIAARQKSRAAHEWHVECECGWSVDCAGKRTAIAAREDHLDDAVSSGAPLRGGGREAPSG